MTNTDKATKPATDAMSSRELLALNMLRLRRAQGLSQEELGFRSGLHRTFIAHVERHVRNISLDNVDRIAYALGVDTCSLLCAPAEGEEGAVGAKA